MKVSSTEDEEIDIVPLRFVLKKSAGLGGPVKIVKEVLCYLAYSGSQPAQFTPETDVKR